MTFGQALEVLKQGKSVSRVGWHNGGVSVHLQVPDDHSKMTLPYIYMEKKSAEGDLISRFPLDLSCESLLADDWMQI